MDNMSDKIISKTDENKKGDKMNQLGLDVWVSKDFRNDSNLTPGSIVSDCYQNKGFKLDEIIEDDPIMVQENSDFEEEKTPNNENENDEDESISEVENQSVSSSSRYQNFGSNQEIENQVSYIVEANRILEEDEIAEDDSDSEYGEGGGLNRVVLTPDEREELLNILSNRYGGRRNFTNQLENSILDPLNTTHAMNDILEVSRQFAAETEIRRSNIRQEITNSPFREQSPTRINRVAPAGIGMFRSTVGSLGQNTKLIGG